MSFKDEYMPAHVPGYPCISVPRTKTTIRVASGGGESRNREWEHPLRRFLLPQAEGREWDVVEGLMEHWLIMSGPAYSFPWADPLDFASTSLEKPNKTPTLSGTDQSIGTGDGFTDTFQLIKTYAVGSETYIRTIHLPVLSSVIIAVDNAVVSDSDYSVSRPGGEVTFNTAPTIGAVITAGFLFDCEVRYESDDMMEALVRTYQVGGFADISLVEVRPC